LGQAVLKAALDERLSTTIGLRPFDTSVLGSRRVFVLRYLSFAQHQAVAHRHRPPPIATQLWLCTRAVAWRYLFPFLDAEWARRQHVCYFSRRECYVIMAQQEPEKA
jgi:hypothetical protein